MPNLQKTVYTVDDQAQKMRKKEKKKRNSGHYLKIYFLTVIICLTVLMVESLFNSHIPCANSATCKSDLSINIDNNAIGIFQGHKIIPPKVDLAMMTKTPNVLGVHVSNEKKHIYVDLSTQMLHAYEGTTKVMDALISSGKWNRTPIGNFNIWQKVPVTRMAGGQGADAYNLPNVQWVMYFYNDFGFHTAYWHNNFGNPMSHGCINMRLIDAKKIYDWADGPNSRQLGTAVSICNQFKEPGFCIQKDAIN